MGTGVGEGWTEEVGEDQEGWIGDGEVVEWKEEAGVHQVVWTGVGEGGAEVGWKEAWKVEEEDGVTGDEEHPWIEGDGLEIGDGVVDSPGVEEEVLTHLYLCSTISRRCPIHQEAEPVMNRKLLEMMMKTMVRILLSLGEERRVRIVVLEEGVGEEAVEWRRLVLVGVTGVVQEEIGEDREAEVVVPGDQEDVLVVIEEVLEEIEEVLEEIEEVLEELGEVMEGVGEDHLLLVLEQVVVGELLIGFVQIPLVSLTAMGQIRVSVLNVELLGLVKKELMGWNLFNINL